MKGVTVEGNVDGGGKQGIRVTLGGVAKLEGCTVRGNRMDDYYCKASEGARIEDVDQSLEALVAELKAQDAWKDTTIVALSDFGRTLTSNGKGTDHAWGGNMFVLGGDVDPVS